MARVRQFAKDMGMSYNQAKNLINKGRKLSDGGSSILEKVKMETKKDKSKNKNKKKEFKIDPVKPFFEIPKEMQEEFNPRGGDRGARPVKASKGKANFPDLTGDGKVTQADILKGRGVFKMGGTLKYREGGQSRGCGAQVKGKRS